MSEFFLHPDLPIHALAGEYKTSAEDFVVTETLAYEPCGEGDHLFLWIEKKMISGFEAKQILANFLSVDKRDIGMAGLKDKYARTFQWVSVPWFGKTKKRFPDPERLKGDMGKGLSVLKAVPHRHKLRRGHIKSNRFEITIRDMRQVSGLKKMSDILLHNQKTIEDKGLLNFYGRQRFGHDYQTLKLGLALLKGDSDAKKRVRNRRDLKRLCLNAVQSAIFNDFLLQRLKHNTLWRVQPFDILKKTDTGGLFTVHPDALDDVQKRLERKEVVITGPVFGVKTTALFAQGSAEEAHPELEILSYYGLKPSDFKHFGKMLQGTRRPCIVYPQSLSFNSYDTPCVSQWSFELPSGSYASVLTELLIDGGYPLNPVYLSLNNNA